MSSSEFVDLLAKYEMTFYWGAIDKKWWIIGQVENGCNQNSFPMPAENFNAAQVAALNYIHQKYKLALYKIHPPKTEAHEEIDSLCGGTVPQASVSRNGKPDQATINWVLTHLMKEQSGKL